MLSIKDELCLAVVEPGSRDESFAVMTTSAVRKSFGVELPEMRVRMTGAALCVKPRKFLFSMSRWRLVKVAIPAGLIDMGTLQGEKGPVVVKRYGVPPVHIVATLTSLAPVVLPADLVAVDVFMAIAAFHSYLPELPFALLLVTGYAGSGDMAPPEWEYAGTVLLQGISGT